MIPALCVAFALEAEEDYVDLRNKGNFEENEAN